MALFRKNNVIKVEGSFFLTHSLSQIHQAIEKAGFEEIVLDFRKCDAAFPQTMLPLCAEVMARRRAGIEIRLELPEDKRKERLFINTNWAHLIDPRRYEQGNPPSPYTDNIPATCYTNPREQHDAVNRIAVSILGVVPNLKREDFQAFEWSINEVTDNVLTHSESSIGGLVQLSILAESRRVQYVVVDAGMGIPASMKSGAYENLSDEAALERAIQEGVTRDKSIGQGNGLFGSYQVSVGCDSLFEIRSGFGLLRFSPNDGLHISRERIPFNGTAVVAEVDFSRPDLLKRALKIEGKEYQPAYGVIEEKYELSDEGYIVFMLSQEAESFGTRVAGTPVKNKLLNLYRMNTGKEIHVDFSDVHIISSSFADEVFGKLFKEIGPMEFMRKIKIENTASTVAALIDKAIAQRMRE